MAKKPKLTDEQIDDIIYGLNVIASDYDREYGLPVSCDVHMEKMRESIRKIVSE